jgi:ribonuclease D
MLQLDLPKDQGSSDWGTDCLTAEQLVYAAHDVFHLHEVLRKQEAELVKDDLSIAWELETEPRLAGASLEFKPPSKRRCAAMVSFTFLTRI